MQTSQPKRTRQERKMARNALFEAQQKEKEAAELERKQWALKHPVSSGIIPVVDYVAPRGSYQPATKRTYEHH